MMILLLSEPSKPTAINKTLWFWYGQIALTIPSILYVKTHLITRKNNDSQQFCKTPEIQQ